MPKLKPPADGAGAAPEAFESLVDCGAGTTDAAASERVLSPTSPDAGAGAAGVVVAAAFEVEEVEEPNTEPKVDPPPPPPPKGEGFEAPKPLPAPNGVGNVAAAGAGEGAALTSPLGSTLAGAGAGVIEALAGVDETASPPNTLGAAFAIGGNEADPTEGFAVPEGAGAFVTWPGAGAGVFRGPASPLLASPNTLGAAAARGGYALAVFGSILVPPPAPVAADLWVIGSDALPVNDACLERNPPPTTDGVGAVAIGAGRREVAEVETEVLDREWGVGSAAGLDDDALLLFLPCSSRTPCEIRTGVLWGKWAQQQKMKERKNTLEAQTHHTHIYISAIK